MRLCVLDTETTGLDADAQFVELASMTFDPADVHLDMKAIGFYMTPGSATFFEALANPGVPIPPEAKATHHITEEDIANEPPPATVLAEHEGVVGEVDYYVAHNAPYDRGILAYVDGKYLKPDNWIDTVQCAKHIWKDAPGYSNQVLRYWLGLKPNLPSGLYPHRALYDVIVTAGILMEMLKLHTPQELQHMSVTPTLMIVCQMKKHKGMLWKNVPKDYLGWVVKQPDMDMNIRHTAMYYLNNQGSLL